MRRLVAVIAGVFLIVPGVVAAQPDAPRPRRPPLITWLDAATLGAGLGGSIALMGVDSRIARRLQEPRYQDNSTYSGIADVAALVNETRLFAAGLLTYGVAKLAHAPRTTTDIAWHTTESIFIASATATVVRGALGRSRPFVTHDEGTQLVIGYIERHWCPSVTSDQLAVKK